ncbi:amidohydrolase family protein [Chloroflexota bacterium]
MKVDIYTHICPKPFIDYFDKHIMSVSKLRGLDRSAVVRPLWDINKRLEIMDNYEDYVQVLVPTQPAAETFCTPQQAPEAARIYNDSMAEIVSKNPDRFIGAVAYLPLNNIDATLREIDRALDELGFLGILLSTPIYELKKPGDPSCGYDFETMKSLDMPEFWQIYEKMSQKKRPIWIHPKGPRGLPVYHGEENEEWGKYGWPFIIGWPVESATAVGRLVFSGVLAKYPNLRFIIHHCGSGVIPSLAGRLDHGVDFLRVQGLKWKDPDEKGIFDTKPPSDYFRMFYADTALYGDMPALMCGHAFFGVEHLLFGTDMPYDIEGGDKYVRLTIDAVNRMSVSDADKQLIFEGNAKRILKLYSANEK